MLSCLAYFLIVVPYQHETGLAGYVGKDLTKLSSVESEAFVKQLESLTKEKADPHAWQAPEPRWIKKYCVDRSEWMLLSYSEARSIPGSGTVKVYGFTKDWSLTFQSYFNTGYRLSPKMVELLDIEGLTQPVLRIHVESLGPFTSRGNKMVPAFHPESGLELYCAFNDSGGYLVRLTKGDGTLVGNSYHGGFSAFGGPDGPPRVAAVWKEDLFADAPVRQLHTIVWLSSFHLNSKDWRREGFARESVASSLSFEALRADPSVKERLKALNKSSARGVREQSAFALKKLEQSSAPVEGGPG